MRRLGRDDFDLRGIHRILKAEPPLLSVKRRTDAFKNGHLVARGQLRSQVLADLPSSGSIVGTDERDTNPGVGQDIVVELVVDIDDNHALVGSSLERRREGLRIRRRNHNRVDSSRDHLFDQPHLAGQIPLVLDAVDDELVLVRMSPLMFLGAAGHGREELVRERLHDQCDDGLLDRTASLRSLARAA